MGRAILISQTRTLLTQHPLPIFKPKPEHKALNPVASMVDVVLTTDRTRNAWTVVSIFQIGLRPFIVLFG